MSSITAHQLCWETPDGVRVLDKLSCSIGLEKVGLVGPNGAGKSTLLRLLAGELRPAAGVLERTGTLAWLPQGFQPRRDETLAGLLGVGPRLEALRRIAAGDVDPALYERVGDDWDLEARVQALLASVGLEHIDPDRRLETLSGGETTRAVLASRLVLEPTFLLLDEPTNHLDRDGREALYAVLETWSGGILVASHDRELLGFVDRILELSPKGLRSYGGAYPEYVAQRAAEDEAARRHLVEARQQALREAREAQQTRERQEQRSARGRRLRARGGMPKMMLNAQRERAQNTTSRLKGLHQKRVEDAAARLEAARGAILPENVIQIDLAGTRVPGGKPVLELAGVAFSYDGRGAVLEDVSLELTGPARAALIGPNGAGKTTLVRLILGELEPSAGVIRRGVERVAYLDQRTAVLDPARSVLENFQRLNPRLEAQLGRLRLGRFLFRGDAALKRVADLSGGERMRAALACVLAGDTPPQLLVLDEPTNNLDLDSIEQVESALHHFEGALLVVSHDAAFLRNVGVGIELSLGGEPLPRPR